jgi:aryl-alcohol dehydrogenase-like predicted oxidoreductase
VDDILDTLNGFLAEGAVRAFGASNWSTKRIREANARAAERGIVGFCANQPQWSLARLAFREDPTLRSMDHEMYDLHREQNLVCLAYSSQAKGFFPKMALGGEAALSEKARKRFLTEDNVRIFYTLERIADRTGTPVGALALAYLTSQPFPVYPIVGVSRVSQVEALRAAGDARMSEEDIRACRFPV